MAQMTDVMVDVETTSTNPHTGGIIQLSAIKFNYETGEIGGVFDRCPMLLPFRAWSEGTREFWLEKNYSVYRNLVLRAEPAMDVFLDFEKFAVEGADEPLRFWSKPLAFDWPFIASHMEQLGRQMPFFYRTARDLNSFISALHGTAKHVDLDAIVPFSGDRHNGLHDCAYQIDLLMYAKDKFVTTEVL